MMIEVRREVAGLGIPIRKKRVLDKGEQIRSVIRSRRSTTKITLIALASGRMRVEGLAGGIQFITRDQLKEGVVVSGMFGFTQYSCRLRE